MTITAQLHDGTRLEFPDGTDPAVIQQTVQKVLGKAPAGTSPSQLKGSVLGGAFMGLRDPIDAGAQLLARGVDAGVRGFNSLTGLDIPRPDVAGVDNIVKDANSEYDASRKMAGRDGLDIARLGGNLLNPANRIVPMGAASSALQIGGRAAAQGAISGSLQPTTDTDNFWQQKALQTGIGAAGGAAGGLAADKLMRGVGDAFASMRARPGFPQLLGGPGAAIPAEAHAQALLANAAQQQGIDLAVIPKAILDDVKANVVSALKQGKAPDVSTLARVAEGKAVLGADAGLMTGQASRDPQLFARELDLRGIQGAGKPIADRLALQNQRLIGAVGKQGAAGAPDAYDAGATAIKSLQALDDSLSKDVTAAYGKFRLSGGATLDVPMQPIAQRLGEVLDTYGKENLPAAVLSKLESYGLMGGKQTKVFDLLEADKLIKTINANFDPMKAPQTGALGAIRKGISEGIDLADAQTQGATGPAADLLREAISKAKARFSLHEAVPALEAAAKDRGTQEAFVRNFITSKSAGVDTVGGLVKLLSPEALDAVKRNVLSTILERAAPGAGRGSDAAKFSQAGFRTALDQIGDRKLSMLFGADGLAQLRQIGRVAEWIQAQPAGSAVNNSNTGAAVMNLIQGLAGRGGPVMNKVMSLPGANLVKNSLTQSLDESAVRGSLLGSTAPKSAQLAPEEVNALRRFIPVTGGLLGGSAASAFR
mgnify:CR=1 FL=1